MKKAASHAAAYDRLSAVSAAEVAEAYNKILLRLIADLKSRIGKLPDGSLFIRGGGEVPAGTFATIQESLKKTYAELQKIAPAVAKKLSGDVQDLTRPEIQTYLASVVKAAPTAALFASRVESVIGTYQTYIGEQGLLTRKIYEKLAGGLRGGLPITESTYGRLLKTGGLAKAPPIHVRLLERTRAELYASIESGEGFNQMVHRMAKNAFGVDFKAGDKHPALVNAEGVVPDASYGTTRGYNVATNPTGVLGDVKRLVRTEMLEAHNTAAHDSNKALGEAGLAIGDHVDVVDDDVFCEACNERWGPDSPSKGDVLFGGELPPLHPNDRCQVTGPVWDIEAVQRAVEEELAA